MTAANCTLEVVSVPLGEVKTILTGAVTSLHALVGQPVEVILASVDGTVQLAAHELATIVAAVLTVSQSLVIGRHTADHDRSSSSVLLVLS